MRGEPDYWTQKANVQFVFFLCRLNALTAACTPQIRSRESKAWVSVSRSQQLSMGPDLLLCLKMRHLT